MELSTHETSQSLLCLTVRPDGSMRLKKNLTPRLNRHTDRRISLPWCGRSADAREARSIVSFGTDR
jgi:hypothetical protein